MILRWVWPHKAHDTLIDFTDARPRRTLELIPGTIKDLHFLQKSIRKLKGSWILYLVLIRRARNAWRLERSGLVAACVMALSIKICILSTAIRLAAGFI